MQRPRIDVFNGRALRAGASSLVKYALGIPFQRAASNAWSLSQEGHRATQARAFKRIYEFARRHVPYYASRPSEYPPELGENDLSTAIKKLPILKKETVRQLNESFWPVPPLRLTSHHRTSGTTGTPLILAATLSERARVNAILHSWYRRICGQARPRSLFLSGFMTPAPGSKEIAWRDPLTGDTYLSIYALKPANASTVRELLNSRRPRLIYGYASALHELARLVEPNSFQPAERPTVVSTSEVLLPHWRETIVDHLSASVYEIYGSQEGCHLALTCSHGRFHIHPGVGFVEILNNQGEPCLPGETGRVVVSGLVRFSMPLFRYELGDVAEAGAADACGCKSAWPSMGSIGGRSEDLVRTRDGRQIGLLCFHATKDLPGIQEAQLVQRGYETFCFRLVLANSANTHQCEEHIQRQLETRLGFKPSIVFEYPGEIDRGSRGKHKAVVVEFSEDDAP